MSTKAALSDTIIITVAVTSQIQPYVHPFTYMGSIAPILQIRKLKAKKKKKGNLRLRKVNSLAQSHTGRKLGLYSGCVTPCTMILPHIPSPEHDPLIAQK